MLNSIKNLKRKCYHRKSNLTRVSQSDNFQGNFFLVGLNLMKLKMSELLSLKRKLKRSLKKGIFFQFNVLHSLGITKKSTASRMGKGKGKIKYWASSVRPGKFVFQLKSSDYTNTWNVLKKFKKTISWKSNIKFSQKWWFLP